MTAAVACCACRLIVARLRRCTSRVDVTARTHRFSSLLDPPIHLFICVQAMNNMHEGPLLDLLHRRYKENVIYTYTGACCRRYVAVVHAPHGGASTFIAWAIAASAPHATAATSLPPFSL